MHIKCYKNFVNGQYLSNRYNECFNVFNPSTGDVIYRVELADKKVKEDEKRAKRQNIVISAAALSAVAVFGIILTL